MIRLNFKFARLTYFGVPWPWFVRMYCWFGFGLKCWWLGYAWQWMFSSSPLVGVVNVYPQFMDKIWCWFFVWAIQSQINRPSWQCEWGTGMYVKVERMGGVDDWKLALTLTDIIKWVTTGWDQVLHKVSNYVVHLGDFDLIWFLEGPCYCATLHFTSNLT